MTSVYAVMLALLAPIIAAVAAHMPRKQLLLAGLGVFVIANLGTAIAPTFEIALASAVGDPLEEAHKRFL